MLTREQMQLLLRAPVGPQAIRDRALLWTAFSTAARASELAGMDWRGLEADAMRFWRPKVKSWHRAPLMPEAVHALRLLRLQARTLEMHGPIFQSLRGGPLSTNGIWRIVDKWGACVGIRKGLRRPHVIRATRASLAGEDEVPILAIQMLLGHTSPTTTARYVRAANGWMEDQMARSGL